MIAATRLEFKVVVLPGCTNALAWGRHDYCPPSELLAPSQRDDRQLPGRDGLDSDGGRKIHTSVPRRQTRSRDETPGLWQGRESASEPRRDWARLLRIQHQCRGHGGQWRTALAGFGPGAGFAGAIPPRFPLIGRLPAGRQLGSSAASRRAHPAKLFVHPARNRHWHNNRGIATIAIGGMGFHSSASQLALPLAT